MAHLEERSLERCGFRLSYQDCSDIEKRIRERDPLVTLCTIRDDRVSKLVDPKVGIYYIWVKDQHLKCIVDSNGILKTFLYTDKRIQNNIYRLEVKSKFKKIGAKSADFIKQIVLDCKSRKINLYECLSSIEKELDSLPLGNPGQRLGIVLFQLATLYRGIGEAEKISLEKFKKYKKSLEVAV